MLSILNLFGRSPFTLLQSHMAQVSLCVHLLSKLFQALEENQFSEVEKIAEQIAELEHSADQIKNNIRNHLPKNIFLPIDRNHLLEILTIQDEIADRAEDIGVLASLKKLELPASILSDFKEFLAKNLEAFEGVHRIIQELHELLESSFGGIEAERVRAMIDNVSYNENEVDLIQRKLLKKLIQHESEITFSTYDIWQRIFEAMGSISNLSEKLAFRIRMTLDIK